MLTIKNKNAWQELIYFFADAFHYPNEFFYQEVLGVERKAKILKAATVLDLKPLSFKPIFQEISLTEIKDSYMKSFLTLDGGGAPPIESFYKVWTEDSSARVAIAGQKGYLMGDSALHMEHLLKVYGFKLPAELAKKPDHLSVILELLGYFLEKLSDQEILQYLKDHLDWLEDFYEGMERIRAHPFYLQLTKVLIVCIDLLKKHLTASLTTKQEVS